jgi:nucleoside-diphosphate-sugar epimerase
MRTKQPYVVYFSSSAAYPVDLQTLAKKKKLKEKDINFYKIGKPDMTYGWTKLTGEMLMNYLREEGRFRLPIPINHSACDYER